MSATTSPEPQIDLVGDERWMSMHNRYVSETKLSESEIVFIGDSIIQGLQFSNLWREKISSLHCINLGIGGDRTQHVLWRILNGEMDFNVKLKAVVLFVGTNNLDDEPKDILNGILECVKVIRSKHATAQIILPTLLPRGQFPNKLRDKNDKVNALLIEYFNNKQNDNTISTHIVPIHENIIQTDGSISHYILYDYLHLTDSGYTKVFTPIYEKLCSIVKN